MFLAYLAGTVSSPLAGRLSDRFGRKRLALLGIGVALSGLALTLPDSLGCITAGLLVSTAGFFAAHSVASSWVSSRAPGRRGQAAAMYLLAYYLGSSAVGALIGIGHQQGGWPVAAAAIGAVFVAGAVSVAGVPALPPSPAGSPAASAPVPPGERRA